MGLHPAALFRQLTARLTVVLHDGVDVDDAELDALRAGGVDVVDGRGEPHRHRRRRPRRGGRAGRRRPHRRRRGRGRHPVPGARRAVRSRSGLRPVEHPAGSATSSRPTRPGATAVPGLYAAGNVTDPSQQVLQAAADGSWVGAMISFGLAHEDIEPRRDRRPTRPTGTTATAATRCGAATRTARSSTRSAASRPAGRSTSAPARAATRLAGRAGLERDGERHLAARARPGRRRGRAPRPAASSATTPTRTRSIRSSRGVRPRVGAVRIDPPHARRPWRAQPAQRGRARRHAARRRATTSSRCAPDRHARATAGRSTPTPTSGSTTSPPRSPTRRTGRSRSTRSDPARPEPPRHRTTSTTSCCAPDGAPTDTTSRTPMALRVPRNARRYDEAIDGTRAAIAAGNRVQPRPGAGRRSHVVLDV